MVNLTHRHVLAPSPLWGEGWGEGMLLRDVSSLRERFKRHIGVTIQYKASAAPHPNPLPKGEREPPREVA
ncbi:hypothetical protein GCM10011408_00720 [Dyella caseinilytica]|nr:hypothetical protein GCM10011408_00720 [Dyella caseinilytica]